MGEYFDWVNVNKREYISPGDFDYDNRFHGSLCKNNPFLRALYELLYGRWMGDPVVFLGDEANIPEDTPYGLLHDLLVQAGTEHYYDFICENYRNVSCLFRDAEKEVRESIGDFIEDIKDAGSFKYANEYGIDIRRPFAGLFYLKGRTFPYILNHTKGVYYSLSETPILYQDGVLSTLTTPSPGVTTGCSKIQLRRHLHHSLLGRRIQVRRKSQASKESCDQSKKPLDSHVTS